MINPNNGYEYIEMVETSGYNATQAQNNSVISPAMLQCMAGVCEMGIALGGICETIKSDAIDYQKLANTSLLFLNRFRKQDSSLVRNYFFNLLSLINIFQLEL
jgi:hypothetical protein